MAQLIFTNKGIRATSERQNHSTVCHMLTSTQYPKVGAPTPHERHHTHYSQKPSLSETVPWEGKQSLRDIIWSYRPGKDSSRQGDETLSHAFLLTCSCYLPPDLALLISCLLESCLSLASDVMCLLTNVVAEKGVFGRTWGFLGSHHLHHRSSTCWHSQVITEDSWVYPIWRSVRPRRGQYAIMQSTLHPWSFVVPPSNTKFYKHQPAAPTHTPTPPQVWACPLLCWAL